VRSASPRTGPAFAGQLCRRIEDPDTNEEFFSAGEIQWMDPARKNNILQQALTPKLVPLRSDQTVISFACGSSFVVASLRDHSGRVTIHSAGANQFGQLGKEQIDITCDDNKKPDQGVFQSDLRPVRTFAL
jgi:hypothetical protein